MNDDEVVSALRCCNRSKGHRCSECPVFSRYEHRICKATVDRFAADLIESLQAQLAERDREIERLTKEKQNEFDIATGYYNKWQKAESEIERLRKFKAYFLDEMYGEGLEVANWHMNGDTEPFDNFFDSAVDYMNGPLPTPPEEGAKK